MFLALLILPLGNQWRYNESHLWEMGGHRTRIKLASHQVKKDHLDGLVQERCNSIANAVELRLSCTNPFIWYDYSFLTFLGSAVCAATDLHPMDSRQSASWHRSEVPGAYYSLWSSLVCLRFWLTITHVLGWDRRNGVLKVSSMLDLYPTI